MKKLLPFLFNILTISLFAQNSNYSGIALNASDNAPLAKSLVMLISAKDSVLQQYTRTDKYGRFAFYGLKAGDYIVKSSYPGFVDYTDKFTLDSAQQKSNDTLRIINKLLAINEIIINKFSNGIRLNGDTTEFLADFFKTNPGATAEDLLKKLPGIQVNKNGEITAQGEKVKKILVDGEEFFPDDPTVATKYLRADMIDKVQVYNEVKDTTSNNAEDKVKTLNLTLKQDKKKGYFGKAEAGSDLDQYTNGGIFSGYFNKTLKAAGYLKKSNFENPSLGWQDSKQFGGSASGGYDYDESYGYYYNNSNFNDRIDDRGIPFNTSAGATFNNSWDSTKQKINASYRFANEGVDGQIIGNSRYFLPDTSYSIRDTTVNRSNQDGHRAKITYDLKADSFNTITISSTVAVSQGKNSSELNSGTAASTRINHSHRFVTNEYNRQQLQGDLIWKKTFTKKSRYFNMSLKGGMNPSTSNQGLLSENLFFAEAGILQKSQTIDQIKKSTQNNYTASFSTSYGDRINKFFNWGVNLNSNITNNKNRINTYNRENGNAAGLVDSLSNNYDFLQTKNNIGFNINYTKKKWNYYASANGGFAEYKQTNLLSAGNLTNVRYFPNFSPNAGLTYNWKKQSSVQLHYSGNTQAPSMSALQPVINNVDPFNLNVGNANLNQSFNHSLNVYLHHYKTIKGRYLSGYLSMDVPRNAFVTSTTVDTNAVRRTMTVNANGNYSLDANMSYYVDLKKLPVSFSIDGSISSNRTISYTNGVRIETNQNSYTGTANISLETDVVELDLNYSLNYNQSVNSLPGSKPTAYIIQTPSYDLEINLPGKFQITHTGEFNIRPASAVFSSNRNVYYMTAGISKFFGKTRDFGVSFYMNDLLNQNQGFNRSINTNLVSEQVYTQLARYWLVKLQWNFASAGGAKK